MTKLSYSVTVSLRRWQMRQSLAFQKGIFMATTIVYWISMYIYVPILSPYLNNKGYSLSFIGIVLGSYGLIQLLLRLPIGVLSDLFRKRKVFIGIGMVCAATSCALFVLPDLWLWPLLGRAIAGICASTWVAFTILYASYFQEDETSKEMGQISVLTVCGQMIGMVLAGWLTDLFNNQAPFIAGIFFALIGLLLAQLLYEPKTGFSREHGMSIRLIKEVIKSADLLKASYLSILAHCVLFITMFGFTPLKATELGASGSQLTLLVLAFMIPHAAAAIIGTTIFVSRYGYYGTIYIAFILSGICTLALAITPNLNIMYATQAINGFAQGLHLPLFLTLAIQSIKPFAKATAMGLYQAIYALGMFAGPFIAGLMNKSFGVNSGFWLGSCFAFLAVISLAIWQQYDKQQQKELQL